MSSFPEVPDFRIATQRGLAIEASLSPDSPVLQEFYAGYDRAFVLANEKEELAGFAECLALNQGEPYRELSRSLGAFREVVMVARGQDGRVVGGANFIAYPVAEQLCLNLNYVYVLPDSRRQGHFSALVAAVAEVAAHALDRPKGTPTLTFIEQNDPLKMSADDYVQDTGHTGLDQVDRIAIWAKLGARIVDFGYVQPALSEAQEADPNLVYSVLGAGGSSLAACTLRAHLERFFSISVLKGGGLQSSPEAEAQIADLTRRCDQGEQLALLDPTPVLGRLKAAAPSDFHSLGAASLRDLVRAAG